MNRKSDTKYVLESIGTSSKTYSGKKLAKFEQLRIEYDMTTKILERELESICKQADSLKKEKDRQRIRLEKLEIENQDLFEIKEKLESKAQQIENSIENFNEKLEISEYSSFMQHSTLEINKTPRKLKKIQKPLCQSKTFKSLPSQINIVNNLKEKVEMQIRNIKIASERTQKMIDGRKALIAKLAEYKSNNIGKVISDEHNLGDRFMENDCFVESIDVTDEPKIIDSNTSKTRKNKKYLKKQKNHFWHISFCSSILCIKIF